MNNYHRRRLKRELTWVAITMVFAMVMLFAFGPVFSWWIGSLFQPSMLGRP